jgi:hypothetical protein
MRLGLLGAVITDCELLGVAGKRVTHHDFLNDMLASIEQYFGLLYYEGGKMALCAFGEGSGHNQQVVQHTVPVIDEWVWMKPGMVLMQDGAPRHSTEYTLQDLRDHNNTLIS